MIRLNHKHVRVVELGLPAGTANTEQYRYPLEIRGAPVHRPGPIPVAAERFLKTRSTCTLIADLGFDDCGYESEETSCSILYK